MKLKAFGLIAIALVLLIAIILLIFNFLSSTEQLKNEESLVNQSKTYPYANVPILTGLSENNIQPVSENPNLIFESEKLNSYYKRLNLIDLPQSEDVKNYIRQRNLSSRSVSFIELFSQSGPLASGIIHSSWSSLNSSWYIDQLPWNTSDWSNYTDQLPSQEKERVKGVIIFGPTSPDTPNFLSQNVLLENITGKYVLVVKYSNAADHFVPCTWSCSDNLFRINIAKANSGKSELIYEDAADSREGWKTVFLDISKYKGGNITFRIEGVAGGTCGSWCAEIAAVDKFYIGELSS